jgi:hypothetical protein
VAEVLVTPPRARFRALPTPWNERANDRTLLLSAIEVVTSAPDVNVLIGPYDIDDFDRLQKRADLFTYRDTREPTTRQAIVVPLGGQVDLAGFGSERVPVARHRRLYVALLKARLADALPELKLRVRRFGLERVRETEDLVAQAFRHAGIARLASLRRLRKHHRTQLVPRTEFVRGRGSLILIALQFDTRFLIDGTAADLIADGADIRGLHAMRDGEYVGRILEANGSTLSIAGRTGPSPQRPGSSRSSRAWSRSRDCSVLRSEATRLGTSAPRGA